MNAMAESVILKLNERQAIAVDAAFRLYLSRLHNQMDSNPSPYTGEEILVITDLRKELEDIV